LDSGGRFCCIDVEGDIDSGESETGKSGDRCAAGVDLREWCLDLVGWKVVFSSGSALEHPRVSERDKREIYMRVTKN
jgi:hypothetical protein